MTLTLTPATEARLRTLAERRGQAPEDLIDALVQQEANTIEPEAVKLPAAPAAGISPTAALFAQWDLEDATDDPEEIARRNREWEETKANLAANRLSLRRIDVSGEEWD